MSQKSQRGQNLQAGKAEKAYKGYLPSVEADGQGGRRERAPDSAPSGETETGPGGDRRTGHREDRNDAVTEPRLERPDPGEVGQTSGIPVREGPEDRDEGH